MAEFSSLVAIFVDPDSGAPSGLQALVEGDTIASSVLDPGSRDAISSVRDVSSDVDTIIQSLSPVSGNIGAASPSASIITFEQLDNSADISGTVNTIIDNLGPVSGNIGAASPSASVILFEQLDNSGDISGTVNTIINNLSPVSGDIGTASPSASVILFQQLDNSGDISGTINTIIDTVGPVSANIATNTTNIGTNTTNIGNNTTLVEGVINNLSPVSGDIGTAAPSASVILFGQLDNSADISGTINTIIDTVGPVSATIATNTTNIGTNTTNIGNNTTLVEGVINNLSPVSGDIGTAAPSASIILFEQLDNSGDISGTVNTIIDTVGPVSATIGTNTTLIEDVIDNLSPVSADIGPSASIILFEQLDNSADISGTVNRIIDTVGPVSADIGTNTTTIGTIINNLSPVSGDIATNTTNIGTNTTNIGTNTTTLGTVIDNLSPVSGDIATNTTNIGTNTTGVTNIIRDIGATSSTSGTNFLGGGSPTLGANLNFNGRSGTSITSLTGKGSGATADVYLGFSAMRSPVPGEASLLLSAGYPGTRGLTLETNKNNITLSAAQFGTTDGGRITLRAEDYILVSSTKGLVLYNSNGGTNVIVQDPRNWYVSSVSGYDYAVSAWSTVLDNSSSWGGGGGGISPEHDPTAIGQMIWASSISPLRYGVTVNPIGTETNPLPLLWNGTRWTTDANYGKLSTLQFGDDGAAPATGSIPIGNGTTFVSGDHGDLGGLSDNDHPQYVLSATNTNLSAAVDVTESDIAVLGGVSANIATNTGNISTNTGNISTNTGNISTNTANISVLGGVSGNIATNTGNISTNTGNISTNTANIAVLGGVSANIATNTGNISTNTGNIATNTANISVLGGVSANIATNTGNISTNTGNISTNTGNISTNTANIAVLGSASGNWNTIYGDRDNIISVSSTVLNNSGTWGGGGGGASAEGFQNWNSTYDSVLNTSANWNTAYTSATNTTDVSSIFSGNINVIGTTPSHSGTLGTTNASTYGLESNGNTSIIAPSIIFSATSAYQFRKNGSTTFTDTDFPQSCREWDGTYTTVLNNSGTWGGGGGGGVAAGITVVNTGTDNINSTTGALVPLDVTAGFPAYGSYATDFSYTPGNAYVTINTAGTYEVTFNVAYTTVTARWNGILKIYKGTGGASPSAWIGYGAGKMGYVRNSTGHNEASLIVTCLVTCSANDTIGGHVINEAANGTCTLVANETFMTIKRMS